MTRYLFVLLILITSCSRRDPKFQQYHAQGEVLYGKYCSNCHQASGKGLGLVYPPLDQSDYMDANFDDVICLMKYGRKGEMIINKENYNHPMPGVRSLTQLEIAEIATYIYNSWGHERGLVEVPQIDKALEKCIY